MIADEEIMITTTDRVVFNRYNASSFHVVLSFYHLFSNLTFFPSQAFCLLSPHVFHRLLPAPQSPSEAAIYVGVDIASQQTLLELHDQLTTAKHSSAPLLLCEIPHLYPSHLHNPPAPLPLSQHVNLRRRDPLPDHRPSHPQILRSLLRHQRQPCRVRA